MKKNIRPVFLLGYFETEWLRKRIFFFWDRVLVLCLGSSRLVWEQVAWQGRTSQDRRRARKTWHLGSWDKNYSGGISELRYKGHNFGIQEGFAVEPREMIRKRLFGEIIRVLVQKSDLQRKSQSYNPKVRVTAGWTPQNLHQVAPNSCLNQISVVLQKSDLKPSWIHPMNDIFLTLIAFCVEAI